MGIIDSVRRFFAQPEAERPRTMRSLTLESLESRAMMAVDVVLDWLHFDDEANLSHHVAFGLLPHQYGIKDFSTTEIDALKTQITANLVADWKGLNVDFYDAAKTTKTPEVTIRMGANLTPAVGASKALYELSNGGMKVFTIEGDWYERALDGYDINFVDGMGAPPAVAYNTAARTIDVTVQLGVTTLNDIAALINGDPQLQQSFTAATWSGKGGLFVVGSPVNVPQAILSGGGFGLNPSAIVTQEIDVRNQATGDVVEVYVGNFQRGTGNAQSEAGDVAEGPIEMVDKRATIITEFARMVSNVATHELGHALGLEHDDSFGDPGVTHTNTGNLQRKYHMSSGAAGDVDEAGWESVRTFSEIELLNLSYAEDNITKVTRKTVSEAGGGNHDTRDTAHPLGLDVAKDGRIDRRDNKEHRSVYLLGDNFDGVPDVYQFAGRKNDVLTIQVHGLSLLDRQKNAFSFSLLDKTGNALKIDPADGGSNTVIEGTAFQSTADGGPSISGSGSGAGAWETGSYTGSASLFNFVLPDNGEYFLQIDPQNGGGAYEVLAYLKGLRYAEHDVAKQELYVWGDEGKADTINVAYDPNSKDYLFIDVNDVRHKLRVSELKSVTIAAGAGNDTITIAKDVELPFIIEAGDGNDLVQGGKGADTIYGEAGSDTIRGGSGNDVIFGDYKSTLAQALLNPALSADVLEGQDDNDSIQGGVGNDSINGGDGPDTVRGNWGHDLVLGGDGNDQVYGDEDHDTLFGDDQGYLAGSGNDNVWGGVGNDTIFGGAATTNDVLRGGDGEDWIFGDYAPDPELPPEDQWALAKDLIYGDAQKDTVFGQGGNDTIHGGDHADSIDGGAGDDNITADGAGQSHDDTVLGGAGKDEIRGQGGNDSLEGGDGFDTIFGGDGKDTIKGDEGEDSLDGGAADDTIYGGKHKDIIKGNLGNDTLEGQDDGDIIYGGAGKDTIKGGEGGDEIYGDEKSAASNANLDPADSADSIYGEAGPDTIRGGRGKDHIEGGTESDDIWGNDDNDTILGGDGNDHVFGDGYLAEKGGIL